MITASGDGDAAARRQARGTPAFLMLGGTGSGGTGMLGR